MEKYTILQERTGATSQQQHRMNARKVSNNLLKFETKVYQYLLNKKIKLEKNHYGYSFNEIYIQ